MCICMHCVCVMLLCADGVRAAAQCWCSVCVNDMLWRDACGDMPCYAVPCDSVVLFCFDLLI